MEVAKNIPSPDPRIVRSLIKGRARNNEIPNPNCPHPMSAIYQIEDVVNENQRSGRPTNLFQCDICKSTLFLVDAFGNEATEG